MKQPVSRPSLADSCGPVIRWWQPECGATEQELVRKVIESNYLNEGEFVDQFEKRLAQLLGVRHAVAVTSGTAALHVAMLGLGIGPGDEVLVPDITFIATANAVWLAGAKPVLVDVDAQTLTISPQAVEAALTPATRAIIPVHVSGRGADMPALLDIAHRHQLLVIEDAAEAFLSRQNGRCLGTFGQAGCFSFSPNKIITTGQGGIVATNDAALAQRLREIKDQGRPVRGTGGDDAHPTLGANFKLTNLQAAVGLGQLELLDERIARARRTCELYQQLLGNVPGVRLPGFQLEQGEFPLWVDAVIEQRDEVDRYLAARHCHCRRFWFPLHTQTPYRLPDHQFPDATSVAARAIWLPSAFQLTDEEVNRVAQHIRDFVGATALQAA